MIATLRGRVTRVGPDSLVIEVGGVGYLVSVPSRVIAAAIPGHELELQTHTYVREDALGLYGFEAVDDLEFFELLMSVKGIGPKVAPRHPLRGGDQDPEESGISRRQGPVINRPGGLVRRRPPAWSSSCATS